MYTESQFISFIETCFGQAQLTGTNGNLNANVVCPQCLKAKGSNYSNKKLAIKIDNQLIKCWVCNFKSRNLYSILAKFKPMFLEEYVNRFYSGSTVYEYEHELLLDEQNSALELPPLTTPLVSYLINKTREIPQEAKSAINYLMSRNISVSDLWYFKFCISFGDNPLYKNRVIVPSYNTEGELNFFVGRTWLPNNKFRYYNPFIKTSEIVFNEINIDWSERLTIVEGPFDLTKVNQNATCLLGSTLGNKSRLLEQISKHRTPILLALDSDADSKQLEIAKNLYENDVDVKLVLLPDKIKDPGSLSSKEEFESLESVSFNMDFYLKKKINLIAA